MNIIKIVDLSIPITNETPIYPGDPKPNLKLATTISDDGYHVSAVNIGSHTGTHVDAPYHFKEDGLKIDQVPLLRFAGEGVVVDVTGKAEGESIDLEDIKEALPKMGPGKIALIHTGWSKFIGQKKYFSHPYLTERTVTAMMNKGVKTFYIDALNIDPPDGSSYTCHDVITGENGIIGENFTNFDLIDFENPLIMALPLSLQGLDGSPVRAVALKLES